MLEHLSWQELLQRWSSEVLAHPGDCFGVTPQMRANGWIGSEPAGPADIRAWEQRIGRPVPPSYEAFVLISDGWLLTDFAFDVLRPLAHDGWVAEVEADLLAAWEEGAVEDDPEDVEAGVVHDDPLSVLRRSLVLSTGPDHFVMDPGHVDASGEWATCNSTNWGGVNHFPSFRAGMEAHYATFVRFEAVESTTRAEVAGRVQRAYRDSLRGDLAATAVFAEAVGFGNERAQTSQVQVDMLNSVYWASGQVLELAAPPGDVAADEPFEVELAQELLPMFVISCLFSEPEPRDDTLQLLLDRLPAPRRAFVRQLIERCRREGGLSADFSYAPAFEHVVERARGLSRFGRGAEAFEHLLEGLPMWTPLSARHLAPVALLWDRDLAPLMEPERRLRLLGTPRNGS